MIIFDETKNGKVAAKIRNAAVRINKEIKVTISEQAPESVKISGTIPKSEGWLVVEKIPLTESGRKDYIRFISETKYQEVWIRVSTAGGCSKIYVR